MAELLLQLIRSGNGAEGKTSYNNAKHVDTFSLLLRLHYKPRVLAALGVSGGGMSIIVAGKLALKPGSRDALIEKSIESITLARKNSDCQDFSVSPDPIDGNRVNIYGKHYDV